MSVVKLTPDAITPDETAIAGAVSVLAGAAHKNLEIVKTYLKAAGFEVVAYTPLRGTPNIEASAASDIGAVIEGRGIYHGAWHARPNGVIVQAYSDTDFLRDASGRQMLLTWYEARDELARRNDGRRYADGAEGALCDALAKPSGSKGAYQDGDLVMTPQVLLNGVDNEGIKVRAGQNTADLLRGSKAFKKISNTLRATGSLLARWSWSCAEVRVSPHFVRAVRLSDGPDGCYTKDFYRLGVLPFRFFRKRHAANAVSHLAL